MKTRSLVTVACSPRWASSMNSGHARGALNNGATAQEIQEVLLHTSIYCGAHGGGCLPLAAEVIHRRAQEACLTVFTAPPAACAPGLPLWMRCTLRMRRAR